VLQQVCPGLVQQIEAGALDTPETEAMLRGWVEPMLARGIDALVLGCTHYPFVTPLLHSICGPGVRIIDPAPAVARQAARLWAAGRFTRRRGTQKAPTCAWPLDRDHRRSMTRRGRARGQSRFSTRRPA
jgi:glutamate racemase